MLTDVNVSSGAEQSTPVDHSAPQAPSEKLVPQSHVDRIAHERHKAGYEKGKSESAQVDPAKFAEMYKEQRAREIEEFKHTKAQNDYAQMQQAIEQASAELLPKLKESGMAKYEDFGKVMNNTDLKNPGLIHALRSVDNPADLVYELSKDIAFETAIMQKLSSDSAIEFEKGVEALKKFSETIKNNESAKSKVTASPLSTVKASSSTADNGKSTITDLRKKFRV